MASGVLSSLALLFIAAGMALFVASALLARQARRQRRILEALLKLGSHDGEPLDLLPAAWPSLHAAGWSHLSWQGNWFGQPVAGQFGGECPTNAPTTTLAIGADDVALQLHLHHDGLHGEARPFADNLASVFGLLLETRVRARTEALSAALAERARLSLYLQHDMRNLAQWVGWIAQDFAEGSNDAALLAAGRRLHQNAPLAAERAERLITALGKQLRPDVAEDVDLGTAVRQAATLAGIDIEIAGSGRIYIARGLLMRILDNLFANLAASWRTSGAESPALQIHPPTATATLPMVCADLRCPLPDTNAAPIPHQLFEPFASGRPGGLGLGLYQARRSLREAGGSLHADIVAAQLVFHLCLPAASDTTTVA